ncbi:MAG: exosortase/archaeosortase family protein [Terracidiphilus sp.]
MKCVLPQPTFHYRTPRLIVPAPHAESPEDRGYAEPPIRPESKFMSNAAKHEAGFLFLCAVFALAAWRPLAATLALALGDDAYTYILLIVPLSAALILREWPPLRSVAIFELRAGSALLAVAAATAVLALLHPPALLPDLLLPIAVLALVLSWIGAFVLCFGLSVARLLLFPLCFLFGLVPLPKSSLNVVVALLQHSSAWAAHLLFALFGVPVAQDGVRLAIPGLTLFVADECSSIRSSSILLVATMVLAQILLRSPWRKAAIVALAVPLSVAKNGLRIFTIAMLGTRVDRGYLTGRLHHHGGVVFLAIILAVVFAAIALLRRGDAVSPSPLIGNE